jgi:hypothetical protein
MNIPESEIAEIRLTWNVVLRAVACPDQVIRFVVMKPDGHFYYIDELGTISFKKYVAFGSFDEAYEFASKIKAYFARPLTKAEIKKYKAQNLKHENRIDAKVYREFYNLILKEKWQEASDFMSHQDTFVREGVFERIRYEIGKFTDEN